MLVGTITFTLGVPVTLSVLEFGFTLEFLLTAGITLSGGMLALAGVFLRPTPEPRVREARILLAASVVVWWLYLGVGLYMTGAAGSDGAQTLAVIHAGITVAMTSQLIWLLRRTQNVDTKERSRGVTEFYLKLLFNLRVSAAPW